VTNDEVNSMAEDVDSDIQRLLKFAGHRPQPPEDVEARVRAATLAAFDELPEPQSAPRRIRLLAIAASLLLVVGAGFLVTQFDAGAAPAGEVLFATGGYTVRGADSQAARLMPGSIVQTSKGGRLLIALKGDRTVRLDHGASLTLHSSSEIWLHRGRIYVDAPGEESMTIVTPFGSVTDVGTQFEVFVAGEMLNVATREGRVDVQLGERTISSIAEPGQGEALAIEGIALTSRTPLPTIGERWRWTQDSRPPFAVQGRSVSHYLSWAARETGRSLKFDTAIAEQQAQLHRFSGQGEVDADHGSVARVLSATSFYELNGEPYELIVGLRSD